MHEIIVICLDKDLPRRKDVIRLIHSKCMDAVLDQSSCLHRSIHGHHILVAEAQEDALLAVHINPKSGSQGQFLLFLSSSAVFANWSQLSILIVPIEFLHALDTNGQQLPSKRRFPVKGAEKLLSNGTCDTECIRWQAVW